MSETIESQATFDFIALSVGTFNNYVLGMAMDGTQVDGTPVGPHIMVTGTDTDMDTAIVVTAMVAGIRDGKLEETIKSSKTVPLFYECITQFS